MYVGADIGLRDLRGELPDLLREVGLLHLEALLRRQAL